MSFLSHIKNKYIFVAKTELISNSAEDIFFKIVFKWKHVNTILKYEGISKNRVCVRARERERERERERARRANTLLLFNSYIL